MTTKPPADAGDQAKLVKLLREHPDRRFSTIGLQMLTGIPSERVFRALCDAEGIGRDSSSCPTQFWLQV